jgi:hypothetical protein
MNGKKTYSIFTYIELKFGKDASSVDNKDKNVHKRRLTVYIETKNLIGHYEDNTTIFKNKVNNAIKGGFAKYNETYSEKIKIADAELYDVEIGSNFIKLYYNVTDEQYVNQEKKQIIRIVKHNNHYVNESEIRMVKDFYREHMSMFLENKDRFIDKNSNLDPMQKQIAKDFFKNHPASESQVDWNKSDTLTYKDFEKIFNDANNTKHALKKASKDNPRLIFEKRDDCKIVGENDKFIFVMPLNYKACIWMDSFDCGGGGAKWCIGYEDSDQYYSQYYNDGYSFVLAFNKQPTDMNKDLKYMLQINSYVVDCWTQGDRQLFVNCSYMDVEQLTGVTKEQLDKFYNEFREKAEPGNYKEDEEEYDDEEYEEDNAISPVSGHKEVLWSNLQDTLDQSTIGLSIKILDPENVVLGNNTIEETLGYIIKRHSNIALDFSPSDFSGSKLLDDTSCMFNGCNNLVKMCRLPSKIINADRMFESCDSLTLVDTSNFYNVTNADRMFSCCYKLISIDTTIFTNVTSASVMFQGCEFTSIDTAAFTKVTNADNMFRECTLLTSIDTKAFKNVINAGGMFWDCTSLTSIDTTAFTNVVEAGSMFLGCSALESIDTTVFKNVIRTYMMFQDCRSLTSIDMGSFVNTTTTEEMFKGCGALVSIKNINLHNVIKSGQMFQDCTSLVSIDLSTLTKAENTWCMFENCSSLEKVYSYSLSDTTCVNGMFAACESLKEISFSSGTEYLEQYEKLITNNEGNLSSAQIENAKMYSSSPVIRFKRD